MLPAFGKNILAGLLLLLLLDHLLQSSSRRLLLLFVTALGSGPRNFVNVLLYLAVLFHGYPF